MTFPTSNEVDNLWVVVKVNENNEWPSENIPNAATSESLLYMNGGTLVSVAFSTTRQQCMGQNIFRVKVEPNWVIYLEWLNTKLET